MQFYFDILRILKGETKMKKTVVTLLTAGAVLGAPFSTAFAEEQASQQKIMDQMEVVQKRLE